MEDYGESEKLFVVVDEFHDGTSSFGRGWWSSREGIGGRLICVSPEVELHHQGSLGGRVRGQPRCNWWWVPPTGLR